MVTSFFEVRSFTTSDELAVSSDAMVPEILRRCLKSPLPRQCQCLPYSLHRAPATGRRVNRVDRRRLRLIEAHRCRRVSFNHGRLGGVNRNCLGRRLCAGQNNDAGCAVNALHQPAHAALLPVLASFCCFSTTSACLTATICRACPAGPGASGSSFTSTRSPWPDR